MASWKWEFFYLLSCWACLLVIGGLLFHYDGKPIPRWPLSLSLTSVITIPTYILGISIARLVYSTMFQLTYLWYQKMPRPIPDLDIFAKAASTIHGAIFMLKLQRFGGLASVLSLAFVASQAISTNVQQTISAQPRMVHSGVGHVPIATRVSRPHSSSASLSNLDDQMVSAMWTGFLSRMQDIPNLPVVCEGNECHWPRYYTISVRHRCESTSQLVVPCGNMSTSTCSHMLPTLGGALMVGPAQSYTSVAYLFPDFIPEIQWYIAAWKVMALAVASGNQTAVAAQCKLGFTIETYSGSMINGSFNEQSLAPPWYNKTTPLSDNPEWIMNPNTTSNNTFSVAGPTAVNMQRFGLNYFTGNSTSTAGGPDYGGRDEHQIQHSSLVDGTLDDRVRTLAVALARTIRIGSPINTLYNSSEAPSTSASCHSFRHEERISINFFWLLSPLIVVLVTTHVFIITVYLTKITNIGIRKGNPLVFLSSAPPDDSRRAIHRDTGSWDLHRAENGYLVFAPGPPEVGSTSRLLYAGTRQNPDRSFYQRMVTAFFRLVPTSKQH